MAEPSVCKLADGVYVDVIDHYEQLSVCIGRQRTIRRDHPGVARCWFERASGDQVPLIDQVHTAVDISRTGYQGGGASIHSACRPTAAVLPVIKF